MQGSFWSSQGNSLEKGAVVSHSSQFSQQVGVHMLPMCTTGVLLPFLADGFYQSDPCPQIYFNTFDCKGKI